MRRRRRRNDPSRGPRGPPRRRARGYVEAIRAPAERAAREGPLLRARLSRKEIEAADWSLTPGRYVGVAPPEEDEDFDFEQTLRDIHTELADLNKEAAELAAKKASEVFYSVTTRVIATRVDALSEEEGVATITVTTQREIVSDDPGNRTVRYQPLLLTFEKIKGVWKVASARWQEE